MQEAQRAKLVALLEELLAAGVTELELVEADEPLFRKGDDPGAVVTPPREKTADDDVIERIAAGCEDDFVRKIAIMIASFLQGIDRSKQNNRRLDAIQEEVLKARHLVALTALMKDGNPAVSKWAGKIAMRIVVPDPEQQQ